MWLKKPKQLNKQQGIAFGVMDGVVNVLGVLLALSVATESKVAIITGVLAAGVANALANSSGFYVSEETEGIYTQKEIITSTVLAFISSFFSAVVVLLPTFIFNLKTGLWIGFLIGILMLFAIGYIFSHANRKIAAKIGLKYVILGAAVSLLGFLIGLLVQRWF